MHFLKTNKFYCFSPPIMIITFLLEVIFAIYVVYRYKLTPISRLAIAILLCLAVFQFAEYNICVGALGVDSLTWARIGYVAITFLPPLGLHLASKIAGQKNIPLIGVAYVTAVLFSYIFLFVGPGLTSEQCLGNYVIFDMAPWSIWPYTIYYYGWLVFAVVYSLHYAAETKGPVKTALSALAIGYLAFIIPTTAVNIIDPSTLAGIPSIMCGFAIILALVLTMKVVPVVQKKARRK